MNFKIRGLGLIVAAFALSAIPSTAASAALYHSELSSTTFLQGKQQTTNVFMTPGGSVKCSGTEFTGTMAGGSSAELVITPSYTGCIAFGQSATVATEGCGYNFGIFSAASSEISIFCPTGKAITANVPVGKCSLTFAAQTPTVNDFDTRNEGSGATRDILFTSTVTGIAFTKDGIGSVCGTSGNASYNGTVLMKGFSEASHLSQVGIWTE